VRRKGESESESETKAEKAAPYIIYMSLSIKLVYFVIINIINIIIIYYLSSTTTTETLSVEPLSSAS